MTNATFSGAGWEGFLATSFNPLPTSDCLIQLQPDQDLLPICSGCQRPCSFVHDVSSRRIRHRDLSEYRVRLEVPMRRVRCPECGVRRELLHWVTPYSRITERLRQQVEVLATLLPLKHVAQLTGLHWHTIKAIDKARLARDLPDPDLSRVRYLAMDEFALFKGHRCASVVMDAERTQVLWVGEGRSREAIRPFFAWLGEHCQHIEAVAMDMNTAMDLEVRAHCPNARIVYDLFHVIAKFGREVVDRVRVDQVNLLRHDKPARRVVKRSRWLLLRNPENLEERPVVDLNELLTINQPLMVVYLIKSQLKELWYARNERVARCRWTHWFRQARASGIGPLIQFANRLKPYAEDTIASGTYRLNTSILEGADNRIKRMTNGFRVIAHFFMKIRDSFPGKAR